MDKDFNQLAFPLYLGTGSKFKDFQDIKTKVKGKVKSLSEKNFFKPISKFKSLFRIPGISGSAGYPVLSTQGRKIRPKRLTKSAEFYTLFFSIFFILLHFIAFSLHSVC